MKHKVLVINPGSTSTKISVFEDERELVGVSIDHDVQELKRYSDWLSQYPFRKQVILETLKDNKIDLDTLSAVASRGGTFGYAKGGAYLVDEKLLDACRNPMSPHASNLGALIAYDIATMANIKAYIYDAICVDELTELAKITGLKHVTRKPFSHVLNTRAVCMDIARQMKKDYKDLNFIAVHLGGGISTNVHCGGRIIDVVSDDEGAFSPERAGRLNGKTYVDMCFSGKYDKAQMMKTIKGTGGFISHLGTSNAIEIEKRIEGGDVYAARVFEAMAYQVAKDIGALSTVVCGKVDRIILTGGLSNSMRLTSMIEKRVNFIAPVVVVPGTKEMEALAKGVIRVLDNQEEAHLFLE